MWVAFAVIFQSQAAPMTNGKSLFEPMIRVKINNQITSIPLEQYLAGVLPSEMPPTWPVEAMKAQAITSRSFVLARALARKDEPYDVESTIRDQVFKPEYVHKTPFKSKIKKILEETRGEVLVRPQAKGEPIEIQKAYFHSDCGGSTEDSFYVWRTKEPLLQVKDASCPLGPFAKWEYKVSKSDLEKKLNLSGVEKILISSRTPSGRVGTLMIKNSNPTPELVLAEYFRGRMGFNKIKSTYFKVRQEGDWFYFAGKGHGHGVGMCQWGARQLAEQGQNYRQILMHYYPLSQVENIRNIGKTAVVSR